MMTVTDPVLRLNREVDVDEYVTGFRRMLAALARRVGNGDPRTLGVMDQLRGEVDQALTEAVTRLRHDPDLPASWSQIAEGLGVSKTEAIRRYGRVGGIRPSGGQPSNWR